MVLLSVWSRLWGRWGTACGNYRLQEGCSTSKKLGWTQLFQKTLRIDGESGSSYAPGVYCCQGVQLFWWRKKIFEYLPMERGLCFMSTLFNQGYLCRGRDPIRIMICFLNCIFGVYSKGVGMATDLLDWKSSPFDECPLCADVWHSGVRESFPQWFSRFQVVTEYLPQVEKKNLFFVFKWPHL